ncbi:putative repeat protein (TIGR01451 family) [Acinetobacter johnsonii]|nr:putative repeat protein (TIGR01451 family) [Acinetobacter johnsonii]
MWGTKLMGKKSTHIITTLIGLMLLSFSKVVLAVPTLEIMSASGSNSSSASLSDKTNTFVFNPANPTNNITQPYFPTTKVTYSITDNPYTGSIVDSYGLFYSANSFVALKDQGFPTNYSAYSNTFSSNRSNVGTGIDLATNYGVRFTTTWDKLEGKSIRTSGLGHYMGEITMRWDRPVTNPVINISGLGGRTSTINSYYYPAYGVSAQFKLLSTTNISQMYKLSGSNFSVSNWEIRNTSSTLGASIDDGGASGSVQLMTSSAITELKFAVYMRSDSSSSERINPSINSGADAFIFSASSIDSMVGDLVVSKTNGTNQVYSGGTTTYTVRVTNNGPDTYTGTELKDVVGTGLTATAIACSNAAGNKCSTAPALNSLASIDTGSLASGEFYEILVTARVDAAVGAKVKNTASVKPPTLGSSTGVACKAALTGTTTGLSRTFDEGTGTCTMSDEDTVQAAPDLQISKTANKDNYTVGEIVTYTIRAWNNSTINVDDAVVTDIIPAEIASLAWTCTKNGTTSTCPTAPAMMNAANSNTLNSTAFKLAANGSSTANYVEFVVTGLAYKEGNVRNTATVSSAILDSVEVNKTNNSAFANINIDTNSPNISGSSQNQCLNSQAVNLVTNTAFSRYDADNTLTAFENNLKTAGSSPTVLPNSIMYGTGPNGALQVKGRLSWSYGSPQSNTTGVTMRILVDGVVYAVLVTPGKSSNSTASFNALNGAQVAQADYALTSYQTDPGSINFTITLPTTVNNVKVVRTEFQSYASSGVAGDDIGIGFNEVNACLKPTFEMNKVSENGTDSFSFGSFSNLSNANAETITSGDVVTTLSGTSQSVRLKSNAGGQGSLLAYATPNTAIRFAESASTLYSLKSVECIDTNRAVSGNTSSNIGSLNGLTHTIPAENVKFASKFVCRVTNAKKAGYVFSGRVFNDNSGTTSDTSKAYNGVIDAGELGIAGSVIELQDCSSKAVLASATSNANGEFRIQTLQDVFAGRSNVCLVQRNVTGYDSVSSAKASNVTATADSTNDQFTIPKANNVTSYEGFLFGDAELQLILSQNGQKTIVAGDVVDYPHELMAKSVMNVLNLTESKEQQPANNQPWQSLVYVDSNCNAQLDQGEGLFTSRVLKANEKVCLIQRVISPTTAQGGDRFIASFKVNGKATYSSATAKESNSVNDITTIGTAGLSISKLVRKTTACPAPSSETTVFTVANQAAKGDYLEYQMTYTNNSNKNLVDVVLKDSVPVGTVYGAMSCTATGCQTQESSGQLKWTIPGVLAPKQKGQVGFCVRIPN